MSNEELNKKLARWAGLHRNEPTGGFWWDSEDNLIFDFHKLEEKGFTGSLDNCFEWLEPELYERGYRYKLERMESGHLMVIVKLSISYISEPVTHVTDDTASLAFATAGGRLIDESHND